MRERSSTRGGSKTCAGIENYLGVAFDTEALLIFYLDEPGAATVQEHMEKVQRHEIAGYLNIVNLAEFVYILYRRDPELALEKERSLRAFGLEIVPLLDNELWRVAASFKARHSLSLADAFAAATAKVKQVSLATGRDQEYKPLGIPLVKLKS
jgi:predicted nucleic acid-binding protein